ncbi:MAG: histidinol-phosphate transaminase [Firmicutes bacterium]|nr:histidinol-phosphate transaminase [Bacillota bacterium]
MSKFLNEKYQNLEVYVPGEQPQDMEYIKLNTNESPYPPAPSVIKAIDQAAVSDLRLYPDPECAGLIKKLACSYGVKPENIYLSNGSDDILNFAFMALSGFWGKVYFPEISYGFYQVYADLYQLDAVKVPLRPDFSIDYKDYCGVQGMVVIANPNAPTGLALSLEEIRKILDSNPDQVVIIDEAYVDFGGTSAVPLVAEYDNLLVVQTFSKSRSMAGARLGFAIANAELIADLNRIKYSTNPYNINRLTLLAGEAALDAADYYQSRCAKIIETRAYTASALEGLGFTVLPSLTNFLFVKSDHMGGQQLYEALKAKGILIRHFSSPKIQDYNRITIGTREQMNVMLDRIQEILRQDTSADWLNANTSKNRKDR